MQMKASENPLGVDTLYVNIKPLERPTKAKFSRTRINCESIILWQQVKNVTSALLSIMRISNLIPVTFIVRQMLE